MKVLAAATFVGCLLGVAGAAFAQTPDYLNQNRAVYRAYERAGQDGNVMINDRCHGISYGTGARSCGTATGGPVGGISGRN